MSNNSEILTIQHLVRVAPGPQVLLFQLWRIISETGIFQGHVQEAFQECLYINCCGIPGHLSPTSSTSSTAVSEKKEGDPDDSQPTDEGNIHMEHSS
jgi:hypothetical protein